MTFPTLDDWRRRVLSTTGCPWPGPRPLDKRDPQHLLAVRGRRDLPEIVDEVIAHRLVILSGESGVGKSSLVSLGLRPALENEGFEVAELRDWSTRTDRSDGPAAASDLQGRDLAASLVEDALLAQGHLVEAYRALTERDELFGVGRDLRTMRTERPGGIFGALRVFGPSLVIVFDQFEELIRYDEELFLGVCDLIVQLNHRFDFTLVLSLRSEYAHKLRSVETQARPFTVTKYVVEPLVRPDEIAEVVRGVDDGLIGSAISEAAADEIVGWWTGGTSDGGAPSGVGLLHLQALLYELHFRAVDSGSATIERSHVKALEATARVAPGLEIDSLATQRFRAALRHAVRRKLTQCETAYRQAAESENDGVVDEPLLAGTRDLIRRITPHLSSGGYKQVQGKWSLALLVLQPEITQLGLAYDAAQGTSNPVEALFEAMSNREVDLLTASRWRLAGETLTEEQLGLDPRSSEPVVAGSPYLAAEGLRPAPWLVDEDDRSAGMMLGQSPWAVLVEEFRRYLFAIEWMEQVRLIRLTTLRRGVTMLSLIHDGFSEALARWSDTQSASVAARHRLTTTRGEEIRWTTDDAPDAASPSEPTVLVNLRWRDSTVRATFANTRFVNCDFRGTRFERCTFHGAVFVNCLLDGSSFERCNIVGVPETWVGRTRRESPTLPSFRVDAPHMVVAALDRYQERERPNDEVIDAVMSVTSGLAARPVLPASHGVSPEVVDAPSDSQQWTAPGDGGEIGNVPFDPPKDGLTIFGGRLNGITFVRCAFGGVLLCDITGSSLDLLDQQTARLEIRRSLIRGMSMTAPVEGAADPKGPVDVLIDGSIVASMWFGERLCGAVRFTDSQLLQVANLSGRTGDGDLRGDHQLLRIVPDEKSLQVDVTNLWERYHPTDPAVPNDPHASLSPKIRQTDFRPSPAKSEIEASRRAGVEHR